jgi:hypothetical protein
MRTTEHPSGSPGSIPTGGLRHVERRANLRNRYDTLMRFTCSGVIIAGAEPDSSLVSGVNRWWETLFCHGRVLGGKPFTLISDQKSPEGWIIYRLSGISRADLYSNYGD